MNISIDKLRKVIEREICEECISRFNKDRCQKCYWKKEFYEEVEG